MYRESVECISDVLVIRVFIWIGMLAMPCHFRMAPCVMQAQGIAPSTPLSAAPFQNNDGNNIPSG
jgi:hypothetical protein